MTTALHAAEPWEPDPWQLLMDKAPDAEVFIREDLGPRWGQTVHIGDRTLIYIAADLGWVQGRCTLAHELHHIILGEQASETQVRFATARWYLPSIETVGAALRDSDVFQAADTLHVTRSVLMDRLSSMTDLEIAAFRSALRHKRRLTLTGSACTEPATIPRRGSSR